MREADLSRTQTRAVESDIVVKSHPVSSWLQEEEAEVPEVTADSFEGQAGTQDLNLKNEVSHVNPLGQKKRILMTFFTVFFILGSLYSFRVMITAILILTAPNKSTLLLKGYSS